jgi:hypothetical protein
VLEEGAAALWVLLVPPSPLLLLLLLVWEGVAAVAAGAVPWLPPPPSHLLQVLAAAEVAVGPWAPLLAPLKALLQLLPAWGPWPLVEEEEGVAEGVVVLLPWVLPP